ncbi:MAG: fimbrillin family protein [Prevotella sp.]
MKKYIFPLSIAATLFAASCSSDEKIEEPLDNSMKTPIEFSMTDNTASASVGVEGSTRAGFTVETGLIIRFIAENSSSQKKYTKTTATAEIETSSNKYSNVKFGNGEIRYWDDSFGRDTKLSVFAIAVPGRKNLEKSLLKGEDTWTETESSNELTWSVSPIQNPSTGSGEVTDIVGNEDLVYSNNIQGNSESMKKVNGVSRWDFDASPAGYPEFNGINFDILKPGRMQFALKDNTIKDGPGKFDKGNLNFTHALCRVTLKVKLDEGFSADNSDLPNTVSNAKLIKMPFTGTFNVQTGKFNTDTQINDIDMATLTAESGIKAMYVGQVLPGYKINNNDETKNVLQFSVGDNTYYVTQKKVYEALTNATNSDKLVFDDPTARTNIIMTEGQNYVLTVTVSKTKIDNITATLTPFTDISGSYERNNAYLSFDFSQYKGDASQKFSLYRAEHEYDDYITGNSYDPAYDWEKGYNGNIATLTAPTSPSTTWTTNWYFENNKTFYHFRTVGEASDNPNREIKTDDTAGEYFEVISGNSDGNYKWGAPMKKDVSLQYDKDNYGFDYYKETPTPDHHISAAIGATESNIHITEVHALSHIRVKVLTTSGDDKVTLYDESKPDENKMTKVRLTHIFTNGKMYMGNGLIKPTGERTDKTVMTTPTYNSTNIEANKIDGYYEYYVVPQNLVDNEVYVGLEIETPDNNIYYVVQKLSEITVSSVTPPSDYGMGTVANPDGQNNGDKITYWYPNCCYTYNITLKKTGISKITCTLADWTNIEGSQDITIED